LEITFVISLSSIKKILFNCSIISK
jgi:hypothetical protein